VEGLFTGDLDVETKADGATLERTLNVEGGDELKSIADEGRGTGGTELEGTGGRIALPGEAV